MAIDPLDHRRTLSTGPRASGPAAAAGLTIGESDPAANHFPRLPWIRRIANDEEVRQVLAAAALDHDSLVRPSHVIELEGRIAGAVSLGTVTLIDVWADRHAMKARNSLHLLNLVENMAAGLGAKSVCLPCAEHSPYRPFMFKFGYAYAGNTGLYYKNL